MDAQTDIDALNLQPVPRPCLICGDSDGARVLSVDMPVCGLGQVRYGLRCCAGCGLVLQDPVVAPELMAAQYALYSNYTAFTEGDPPLSGPARRMLQLVADAGLSPSDIYDVGAATGHMLWHFRQAGWEVAGCDLSAAAVQQARSLYGIDLSVGYSDDALKDRRDLNLISLSHVLEHIYDPRHALTVIHEALHDQGYLLIEVPCLIAPERNPIGLFTMEHVTYFDETSLNNLLSQCGFSTVHSRITYEDVPFPVITVLARKARPQPDYRPLSSFEANLVFCDAYTHFDAQSWQAVDQRIKSALQPGEPVYIWSAGIQTSMLLSRTSLATYAHIVGITDRDTQKQGRRLAGHTILPPQTVMDGPHKIIVSSYRFATDITQSLVQQGSPPERLVQLYGS